MGKNSENAYLKQCRKGKLKIWTRFYLYQRGKHDARKNIVRADENGKYSSPYIYQEIQTYMLALQTEKARFCDSTMSAISGVMVFEQQIQQKQSVVTAQGSDSGIAAYEKDSAKQSIAIFEAKKMELLSYIMTEENLERVRAEQLCSVLRAKIAVYWNGVLHGCGECPQMPSIVAVDHLIHRGEEHDHEEK